MNIENEQARESAKKWIRDFVVNLLGQSVLVGVLLLAVLSNTGKL